MQLHNFVGGAHAETTAGESLDLVDPSTGETYGISPVSRWPDVDAVLRVAEAAHGRWSETTPRQRQNALLRIAAALEDDAEQLTNAECRSTGKPRHDVRDMELPMAVDLLRFYAGAARTLETSAAGEYADGHTSFARRESIGVCAQVSSWTHPLLIAVSKVAPALAAGNTVVLKPAETTPLSALRMVENAAEFLPSGVLNLICGDRDTGRAMVAHEIPGMFSITGTVRSGMEVAGSAAADLKRVHLQLGGKAPAVVFDDADVSRAARNLAAAAFGNAGQNCTAASRILVADAVHDDLVAALGEQARATRTGPPHEDVHYGPLNSAGQRELVQAALERLPEHARIVTGGNPLGERGFFHEPTVVDDIHQDDELVQHEILGPVVTVQRFSDEATAVSRANGVRYGLAAGVWTRDHARALRMSRTLRAGTVWVNAHHPMVAEMPHTGFKHSASGRDLGRHGLEEYSRIKHVMSYSGE